MGTKTLKERKPPHDADYRAAWRACREPATSFGGREIDLRTQLTRALNSGWSIPAIKAYAWCYWTNGTRYDHLTASAWRYAVEWISYALDCPDSTTSATPSAFLERFTADPERYEQAQ